ncbi:hypothetical protein EHQ46_04890 [Leptospira yanagawae]|uniref:Thioesterase domain-containing protein n=2 Tax=Leptospira yanagawae TaxID=293069 RepID=A0ABY2M8S2_9LEPT|nr:hypothetical protein EHQ46_04890 [Leptospira yanagawae]
MTIKEFRCMDKHLFQRPGFNDPFPKVEEYYNRSLQLQNMGAEIKFVADNLLTVTVSHPNELHKGGMGVESVNGAVISYLFDLALGLTAYLIRDPKIQTSVTARLKIRFKKPLITKRIIVYAKVNQAKKNLIDSVVWVIDQNNQIAASANGIVMTKT